MITRCQQCKVYYDNHDRYKECPHDLFPALSGELVDSASSYRSELAPQSAAGDTLVISEPPFTFDQFVERVGGWGVLLSMYLALGGKLAGLPVPVQAFLGREFERVKRETNSAKTPDQETVAKTDPSAAAPSQPV